MSMLRRLRWIITALDYNNISFPRCPYTQTFLSLAQRKSILESPPKYTPKNLNPNPTKPIPMLEAFHEIAIYIHRFHNLDLFQQGWYQIKITMRWEDGEYASVGTPARVVQYEAPDLGSDDMHGVWRIDDTEHSFTTHPFRIRYARQDIFLSVMISFNLSLVKYEGPSTSAVILKFELMYTPVLDHRSILQASFDASAVHEFRIPSKALLGLHSYCPVYFDAFHAVLVDLSVHISLLTGSVHTSADVPSNFFIDDALADENCDKSKQVMLLKAFLNARDILLEELGKLSEGINQKLDLTDFTSKLDDRKLFGSSSEAVPVTAPPAEVSGGSRKSRMSKKISEKPNGSFDFQGDRHLNSLSEEELLCSFHSLGDQMLYLWNTFLKFHRANKSKIMEYLREAWATDRRAEWSIWMVYSKVEMPHQYISSGVNDSSHQSVRGKASIPRKFPVDPAQTAAMRAELHRRSIAQMRINSRSIQDLHIFGDPSRIPIVIVERVMNVPQRSSSGNSYFTNHSHKDTHGLLPGAGFKSIEKLSGASPTRPSGRVLKIVVFVHGFQIGKGVYVHCTVPDIGCATEEWFVFGICSIAETLRLVGRGHHLDLRLVRNQWLLIDPKAEFLMSEVNEEKTSGDFREMGQRLAKEVISFVKKKMDKASRSGGLRNIKLSFVGHSIGNIIIRTALTESIMEPYLRFLYTYVSVSGPHLGYLYSSNSLFNSGLWLLKKLKGTQCIHQLTFTDDPDLQKTFFYKLCKQKTLVDFKNIILLSSPQDGYVPYHSARIEMCSPCSGDNSKKGKVFLEMLNDCLDQIRAPSSDHRVFMRCDVNFDVATQSRNLNTFIGRAAHIEFLESDFFARFIMWSFPDLFR